MKKFWNFIHQRIYINQETKKYNVEENEIYEREKICKI